MTVEDNYSLRYLNTFKINAIAEKYCQVKCKEDIIEYLDFIRKQAKYFVLGGGANLIFLGDYKGLILDVNILGIEQDIVSEDEVLVRVGAGVIWHDLVEYCMQHNYFGLENLALIPGKVGAAPVQNIGAYGVEQKDCFDSLLAIELDSGKEIILSKDDCQFGYRDSIFKSGLKNKVIITEVRYKLSKIWKKNIAYKDISIELEQNNITDPSAMDVFNAICDVRTRKLPSTESYPNVGSFFKNPIVSQKHFFELQSLYPCIPSYEMGGEMKIPAAWLIETLGWKGRRIADVGIYEKHALVIVNYGHASGKEIIDFSDQIINHVHKEFNIVLEREAIIVK